MEIGEKSARYISAAKPMCRAQNPATRAMRIRPFQPPGSKSRKTADSTARAPQVKG